MPSMQDQETTTGSDTAGSTINPQKVSRRSFRSNSDVRHGRLYEDPRDSVRLVTPDPPTAVLSETEEGDLLSLSPQVLPYRSRGSISGRDTSASISNTDEENVGTTKLRKASKKNKPRHDMLFDPSASPGSFLSKTKSKLGSLNTKTSNSRRHGDGTTSMGHSAVTSPTTVMKLPEARNSLPRIPRRTISSDTATTLNTPPSVRSPLALNTDSQRILNLMRTTCGRMHGILFFRPIGTSAWESGYCAINVAPGSLVCQKQGELSSAKVLLPDLRGCSVRTNYDTESQNIFISVVLASSGHGYQLRPPVPETFDSWLAALLCWQPLRPKGIRNKMTKVRHLNSSDKRPMSQRQWSDTSAAKSAAVVKIGRMMLWDSPLPVGSQRHLSRRTTDYDTLPSTSLWRKVSCALHENGVFRLLTEVTNQVVTSIRLPELARCAIQRLDHSVLDAPHCLAIYPQYTSSGTKLLPSPPLVLGLETKHAYEAWFVLLRTLTTPELYGLEPDDARSPDSSVASLRQSRSSMFRIERELTVKITEAKLNRSVHQDDEQHDRPRHNLSAATSNINLYAEIVLGQDLRARTMPQLCSRTAFWAEEFAFPDLPSNLATLSILVKVGSPTEQEWSMVTSADDDTTELDASQLAVLNDIEVASHDPDYGSVDLQLEELERERTIEKWWQILDKHGRVVGTVLARLALIETIVLVESSYTELSALLHTFDNGLTLLIALSLGQELKTVSELLLDIFQASNSAHEWIKMLVEEEIDGVNKDVQPVRMRFSGRVHSNDSSEAGQHREALVRDLSRSATVEANLLFRGNSLVTKALDAHMRRLGMEYLENTLGEKLRQILSQDADCEVDPSRIRYQEQLAKNWSHLIRTTNEVWTLISSSAAYCPPALRMIFKHIRSCAEDRYGSFIRTVKYTSVSGFLFLRFFCPAILNPKLFGLIKDHPPERARRTFTLIAKSLNVLASMSKFGTKETWMEPMNKFLQQATPEFKAFVEKVCSISSTEATEVLDPQFLAPMQMRARLSQLSCEGLPVLPYLLDPTRSLAALVELWIKHDSNIIQDPEDGNPMDSFRRICHDLHDQTQQCLGQADPAQKPDRNLEPQWQQLLNNQQKSGTLSTNPFEDSFRSLQGDQDITALPQRPDSDKEYGATTNNSMRSTTVSATTADGRRLASAPPNLNFSTSASSSTLSFDSPEEARRQVGSREGTSKGRIFEYLNPARRRNKPERPAAEHDHDHL